MKDLSIIILSYNTKEITKNCLNSLIKNLKRYPKLQTEVIVVENASTDGSVEMLRENKDIRLILNKQNVGYSKGNNQAIRVSRGKYILLLNSDTQVEDVNFSKLIQHLEKDSKIGALTVKVVLPDGTIDPASHRGFPTVWNSFSYFSGLEKLLGKIPGIGKYFGGYHLTHLNLDTIHEIDSPTGAFFLIKTDVLNKVKGFDDKNFFMYGEDLDLSYRIRKAGYKILYYPHFTTIHLKHTSGLKKKDEKTREQTKEYFYDAMRKFYEKHYQHLYPKFITKIVYFFIDLKRKTS